MEQQLSVWRIALGTILGNIGCMVVYFLFICMIFALFTVMGASAPALFRNLPAGLR